MLETRADLWRQVWGVAAMIAAIVICWSAYGFYQPLLLERLGWAGLASWLGIWQGLLGAVVEPIFGRVSDRWLHHYGSRLPLIATGITLAGLLFIVIATLLWTAIPSVLSRVIPVLMTFWVIAMIIFRGPTIALLRQLAPVAQLPQASALLTLSFGFAGALEPWLEQLFRAIGAISTFWLGATVLLLAALALWRSQPQLAIGVAALPGVGRVTRQQSLLIFAVGTMAGIAANLALRLLPDQLHNALHSRLPILTTDWVLVAILIIAAIAAVPLEICLPTIGIRHSMVVAIGVIALIIISLMVIHQAIMAIVMIILCGIALGLLLIDQVPFALTQVPAAQAGWGTGLYFGGIGGATALVGAIQLAGGLSLAVAATLAIAALAGAIGCLGWLK
jgi:hypothetical protein